jgi:hypothetical protein
MSAIEVSVEIVSALLCFALLRFMYKPYKLTRESRYLGLPLGFAFLGIAEILLVIGIEFSSGDFRFYSLLTRTFAYVFLAVTYFFSKRTSNNSRLFWNVALSLIVVALVTFCVFAASNFQMGLNINPNLGVLLRILALFCISYIIVHTLRNHIQVSDPTTIWTPVAFGLLGVSQYSLIIWASDAHFSYGVAFAGGIVARLSALSIFVVVSYLSFYKNKEGTVDERNST